MNDIISELHKVFNTQKRFYFPFKEFTKKIPKNGIYIIFEKGEKYKNFDRIVRVGTHTGDNQLYSRLEQHFIKENKNRSIFRKNIWRCFLNKEGSSYINLWELDTTSKIDKEKNWKLLNSSFEKEIEKRISDYIQNNLSFCVFQINEKNERLFWESKIASTLAQIWNNSSSENWLGNYSTKEKIRVSGLRQVNELNNSLLTEEELEMIKTKLL